MINNIWKITCKDWIATIYPKELTIEQLISILQDEKCSWIEWVIVNWCEVTFRRLKNKWLDWFNS